MWLRQDATFLRRTPMPCVSTLASGTSLSLRHLVTLNLVLSSLPCLKYLFPPSPVIVSTSLSCANLFHIHCSVSWVLLRQQSFSVHISPTPLASRFLHRQPSRLPARTATHSCLHSRTAYPACPTLRRLATASRAITKAHSIHCTKKKRHRDIQFLKRQQVRHVDPSMQGGLGQFLSQTDNV